MHTEVEFQIDLIYAGGGADVYFGHSCDDLGQVSQYRHECVSHRSKKRSWLRHSGISVLVSNIRHSNISCREQGTHHTLGVVGINPTAVMSSSGLACVGERILFW